MIVVSFLGLIVSLTRGLLIGFSRCTNGWAREEMVSVEVAMSTLTGFEGLYSWITAFSKCEEAYRRKNTRLRKLVQSYQELELIVYVGLRRPG